MSENPSSSSSFAATLRSSLSTIILNCSFIQFYKGGWSADLLQVHRINWPILGRLEYFDGHGTSRPKIAANHFWRSRFFRGLWSDILEYQSAMDRNDTCCDPDRYDSCHCSDTKYQECDPFQMLQQYRGFKSKKLWHLYYNKKRVLTIELESYLAI